MNRNKELKLELLQKHPYCHWCGIEVGDYLQVQGVRMRKDAATIDHLVNRRFRKKGEVVEKVLACYDCNSRRDTEDSKYMNPEWLRTHA